MNNSVGQKKFILLDRFVADTAAAEMEFQGVEWELSSPVDDADITFTGKSLSTLFEEGRREELKKSLMSEETDTQNDQCCKCRERADQTVLKRSICYIKYTNLTATYHIISHALFRVSQSKAKTPPERIGKAAESERNWCWQKRKVGNTCGEIARRDWEVDYKTDRIT